MVGEEVISAASAAAQLIGLDAQKSGERLGVSVVKLLWRPAGDEATEVGRVTPNEA